MENLEYVVSVIVDATINADSIELCVDVLSNMPLPLNINSLPIPVQYMFLAINLLSLVFSLASKEHTRYLE